MQGLISRRLLVMAGTVTIASVAHAQQSMAQFVGRWKGRVPGLGDYTVGANSVLVLGPPQVFDGNNIDQFNF